MIEKKELLLIQFLIITFAASVISQSNCMPITARNRYDYHPDGTCFEILISELNPYATIRGNFLFLICLTTIMGNFLPIPFLK